MKNCPRFWSLTVLIVMLSLVTPCSGAGDGGTPQTLACAEIATLKVPDAVIRAATSVSAGERKFVQSTGYPTAETVTLPAAVCRVRGTAMPTSDSSINFELWIPAAEWNQKLMVYGNGGYSGRMNLVYMPPQFGRGYATLIGDTGHDTEDMMFVVGHPERMTDWGYRSVHAITKAGKYILTASQGIAPKYSYYQGCSTGGGQGFAEAQRYPEDFDGILAGDPGNNRLRLNIGFLNMFLANHNPGDNVNPIIPISITATDPVKKNKLAMIQEKIIEICDPADGVKDGIIDDPRLCVPPVFDASRDLLCKGADAADCLTTAQLTALNNLHTGAIDKRPTVDNVANPHFNKPIYQWPKGAEASMLSYMGEGGEPARIDFWRYWVFDNRGWDWWTFDFNRDFTYALQTVSPKIDNINPDLTAFKARKGKMIIYNGLADGVVSATDTALYYDNVVKKVGGTGATALVDTQRFVRLFLIPGMAHCVGGFCPNRPGAADSEGVPEDPSPQNNWIMALENWVENGVAPDIMIGATLVSGKVDMTRPICAYPKIAKYKGAPPYNKTNAAVKSATNWSCENP